MTIPDRNPEGAALIYYDLDGHLLCPAHARQTVRDDAPARFQPAGSFPVWALDHHLRCSVRGCDRDPMEGHQ